METARQALSPKVLSPKGAQTPVLSHQDVVSHANLPHVDAAQPVEPIAVTLTEPAQSAWRKAAPAMAATALATTGAAMSTRTGGGAGSWVWALLSLLIGIGIGALLLYLYALSIARP
jgi:fatty acid desaturase